MIIGPQSFPPVDVMPVFYILASRRAIKQHFHKCQNSWRTIWWPGVYCLVASQVLLSGRGHQMVIIMVIDKHQNKQVNNLLQIIQLSVAKFPYCILTYKNSSFNYTYTKCGLNSRFYHNPSLFNFFFLSWPFLFSAPAFWFLSFCYTFAAYATSRCSSVRMMNFPSKIRHLFLRTWNFVGVCLMFSVDW